MGSSPSLASGNKAKEGGEWKGSVVTFHTRRGSGDYDCSTETFMTRQVAKEIEDRQGNQKIEFVEVWETPLYGWQLTMLAMHHQFVILKTYSWWWSVEKTTSGIIIQRGKEQRFVLRFQGHGFRNPASQFLRRCTKTSLNSEGRGTFSE
eukprot:Selendium_serpulae@DN2056_c0_g1_i1.p1